MGSNLVNPKTAINVLKQLNLSKILRLPKVVEQNQTNTGEKCKAETTADQQYVDIHPPKNASANDFVSIRIISHQLRKGMVSYTWIDFIKLLKANNPIYLIMFKMTVTKF